MNVKYIIIAIIILAMQKNQPAIAIEVSPEIFKKKMKYFDYHHVIDTRNYKERQTGYHSYSMNISSNNLNSLPNKIKNKYRNILIISKTGKRAVRDANIVTSMGYRNVEYLNTVWTRLI